MADVRSAIDTNNIVTNIVVTWLQSVFFLSQFSFFMNHHSGNRHVRMLLFGLLYGLGQRLRCGHKGAAPCRQWER